MFVEENFSSPSLQKNNDPFLNSSFNFLMPLSQDENQELMEAFFLRLHFLDREVKLSWTPSAKDKIVNLL